MLLAGKKKKRHMLNIAILVYHCPIQNKEAVFKGHYAMWIIGEGLKEYHHGFG